MNLPTMHDIEDSAQVVYRAFAAMCALGVTLIEHGTDFQESREHAMALATQGGRRRRCR